MLKGYKHESDYMKGIKILTSMEQIILSPTNKSLRNYNLNPDKLQESDNLPRTIRDSKHNQQEFK